LIKALVGSGAGKLSSSFTTLTTWSWGTLPTRE